MRIAVTGTTGRVGAALARHFQREHEVVCLPRSVCDLADRTALAECLDALDCEVLLNPAGITSLEACEDDPRLAMRVNAEAPAEIANWAASRGVKVFHFSTDYVFGGDLPGLRCEADEAAPVSAYGRSKLAGERAVLQNPDHCVVRISWVFGPEKPSFIDQQFEAALAGRPLAAVADKISLPVLTTDLCGWMERLILTDTCGVIHACNSGTPTSWHGLTLALLDEMLTCGILTEAPQVQELRLAEMTSFRAVRPRFTALDTQRLSRILGELPRPWRAAVADYVRLRNSLHQGENHPCRDGKMI
jgi:dTDP-4-dehydrorhamnose reductase